MYCSSFFSVTATKSLLAFLYSKATISPNPWYSFQFCSVYFKLCILSTVSACLLLTYNQIQSVEQ